MVDVETAYPITAETIKYGTRVAILGLKCDDHWRTPKGIELSGPKKFDYDIEFVEIEKRFESYN